MGRASVPPREAEKYPTESRKEAKRRYLSKYINAVSFRACSCSFIITKNRYIGLALYKTRIGEL
jgi:hypothetical protein